MSARLAAWWNALWFAPGAARTLAGVRIAIALHALWLVLSRDFVALGTLPAPFWAATPASTRWRYALWLPSPAWAATLTVVLLVLALLAVAIGWRARLSAAVAALLLYHVAPLEVVSWTHSAYERGFEVSIIALIVLAASPSGDAWRLGTRVPVPDDAPDYRWPVVLIRLVLAQVYFAAGWSKLARVGIPWVSADNMHRWLVVFAEQDQVGQFSGVGLWLAGHPMLCFAAAAGALALDLSFITSVVSVRARRLLVPAALAMHTGIVLAMNIVFLNAPQLLVFADWDAIARRFGRQSTPTS